MEEIKDLHNLFIREINLKLVVHQGQRLCIVGGQQLHKEVRARGGYHTPLGHIAAGVGFGGLLCNLQELVPGPFPVLLQLKRILQVFTGKNILVIQQTAVDPVFAHAEYVLVS